MSSFVSPASGSGAAAARSRRTSFAASTGGAGIPYGNIDLKMIQGTGAVTERTVPRKTKIVCTIGPACWDVPTLSEMLNIGMSVARLNFSHGDHAGHGACLARVREAAC